MGKSQISNLKSQMSNGFTLIELLVVIAIMAVIGTYTLSNYTSFGEDRKLKNAVLDIQSLLRQAQTNAAANAVCNSLSGASWQVEYTTGTTAKLNCQELLPSPLPSPLPTPIPKKTLNLTANIEINSVSGVPALSCPSSLPFTISFAPVSGGISFIDSRCTSLTITLKNTKTQSSKSLTIEKGGRIYEQ